MPNVQIEGLRAFAQSRSNAGLGFLGGIDSLKNILKVALRGRSEMFDRIVDHLLRTPSCIVAAK